MKRNYLILAIVGIVALIAILTNPNQDRHKEVIKNKLISYMQNSMNESSSESKNEWEKAGQALGLIFGGALVDIIIDNLVSTDNYILFSTTKISWDGETKVIGIGAFGNVFITNKLEEAMNEGLLKNQ
ncbi:MAG: DUF4359 domain-containing protein [Chitinophagales bacterium]|nr:DUF4359 domain-containing protein [Chitinophagales bacterium]MCZ2394182.1 DUF4359 domain-containing protein [Chitinophagales bacterium]